MKQPLIVMQGNFYTGLFITCDNFNHLVFSSEHLVDIFTESSELGRRMFCVGQKHLDIV